ncbi:TetR/AcrR family transcriptional regulator [Hoeflea sp. TYP-13]|uniref:TetR/AcrR family transcriptional regulator n=1 Tax=Hoeflea sp. TYP-13 TaxID=3230023 RepID=UPI0034C5BF42
MTHGQLQKTNPLMAPGRRLPKQSRSRKTVELILDTTLGILEQEGFSGVTMQKIADQAGINVAAVYGYFPNKHHVIAELNERMFAARHELRARHYEELLRRDGDWADNFADSLRELATWRSSQQSLAVLRNAMRASPSLWRLSRENFNKSADQLTRYLEKADPNYAGDQTARARVISDSIVSVLDVMQLSGDEVPPSMLDELIEMVRCYLKSS